MSIGKCNFWKVPVELRDVCKPISSCVWFLTFPESSKSTESISSKFLFNNKSVALIRVVQKVLFTWKKIYFHKVLARNQNCRHILSAFLKELLQNRNKQAHLNFLQFLLHRSFVPSSCIRPPIKLFLGRVDPISEIAVRVIITRMFFDAMRQIFHALFRVRPHLTITIFQNLAQNKVKRSMFNETIVFFHEENSVLKLNKIF